MEKLREQSLATTGGICDCCVHSAPAQMACAGVSNGWITAIWIRSRALVCRSVAGNAQNFELAQAFAMEKWEFVRASASAYCQINAQAERGFMARLRALRHSAESSGRGCFRLGVCSSS